MIRITLNGVPPSLNQFAGRENAWRYRETKERWTAAVQWAVKAARAKPPEPYKRASVELLYYFPTRSRHDPDNYSGKFLLDGLTLAGVIADDSFGCITLSVGGAYDKTNPRTVITVREVDE